MRWQGMAACCQRLSEAVRDGRDWQRLAEAGRVACRKTETQTMHKMEWEWYMKVVGQVEIFLNCNYSKDL